MKRLRIVLGTFSLSFLFLSVLLACLEGVSAFGQDRQAVAPPPKASAAKANDAGGIEGGPIGDASDLFSGGDLRNANGGYPEDWNNLKIPKDLKVADPTPPIRGDFPGFSREVVQLTWRPWDIIDLYVLKPEGVKNPPVILYLYSFPSDTERFKDNDFAKIVTKNGFAAVGFVSALTGPRFHDRPMKEWFVSDLQEALGSSVHDVQLILNYLASRGDLDMTRVGMFGDGSGASIAILAASVDPRIRALDLFDAWGDWPDWMAHSTLIQAEDERPNLMKPEFLKKVENLDPIRYLPQLKTQQVRLQYLETDTVTPKAAQEKIEAAVPPNAQVLSFADSKAFLKYIGNASRMFDWIQEQVVQAVAANQDTTTTEPGRSGRERKSAN